MPIKLTSALRRFITFLRAYPGGVNVSYSELEDILEVKERACIRLVKKLEEAGVIQVSRDRTKTNHYQFKGRRYDHNSR